MYLIFVNYMHKLDNIWRKLCHSIEVSCELQKIDKCMKLHQLKPLVASEDYPKLLEIWIADQGYDYFMLIQQPWSMKTELVFYVDMRRIWLTHIT